MHPEQAPFLMLCKTIPSQHCYMGCLFCSYFDEPQKSNFELAQEEANKIDLQIIDTLQKGYYFRVEAGAGSGKIRLLSGYK